MIDRTKQPQIKEAEKPAIVVPTQVSLDNGIPVHVLNSGPQEVTRLDFIFDGGIWHEEIPLQAALTNAMLQEGCKNYSGAQLAEIFDFRGAYIQFIVDHHFGTISLICLNKHLPHLLPVIENLIKEPLFDEREFETLVRRRKQRFLLENEKVKVICQKKFSTVLFGKKHPYSQTVQSEDFNSISIRDLFQFYKKFYHSGSCRILAVGNTDPELPQLLNKHFGADDWRGEKPGEKSFAIQPSAKRKFQVEKKDAIQSAIRVGRLIVKKDHPDYPGLLVLNTILGGYFSSRLMTNIREEKGYTYGIGSTILSLKETSYWVIATETDQSYVKATIKEIFKELKRFREELVTEFELNRVKQYLLGEFIRDFDGPFAQAQSFRNVADFGLDHQFYEKYYQTIKTISPQMLNGLANKYLCESGFYTVVAGA